MNSLFTRSFSRFFSPSLSSLPHDDLILLRFSFSTASFSPAPHASSSSSHSHWRHNEQTRAVRVSVWWDFENCSLPAGVNVFRVAHFITSAVRASGIKGPLQITAFGDVFQLPRLNQEALSATGITLTHVPRGGKNSADRSLLVDLMYWVSQNPPPAHLFLISGDRDFAGILHRLRMSNYNILLACPESAPIVLCSAASVMWHWNALIKGENTTGRHFNQPPDGPYNSWYGHYKGVLEDPYAVVEPPAHSETDDISDSEQVSGTKAVAGPQLEPVPKVVLKKISRIVNSYPKGILISELRSHMFNGKVSMDKEFCGYKTFSRFLLSKPHIVKLKPGPKGQFLVFPASRPASKPVQCSTDSETQDYSMTTGQKIEPNLQEAEPVESISDGKTHDLATASMSNTQANSVIGTVDKKPPLSSSVDMCKEEKKSDLASDKKKTYAQVKEGYKPSSEELPSRKASGANVIENHIAPSGNQDTEAEMGFFQKIWTKWFSRKDMNSDNKTGRISDKFQASYYPPQPLNDVESLDAPDSHQSSNNRETLDAKGNERTSDQDDKSNHTPGFFTKILGWFRLSRKDSKAKISSEPIEKFNQTESSKRGDLFLMDSFWSDIESFLNTYKGSKVIWNSRTREEIAQNLRKEGPLVIQPLEEHDLLRLIDLLISEKKWIEECPSKTCPFRVVQRTRGDAESVQSNNSNRMRSILSSSSPPDELPGEQDNGENHNSPCPRVPFNTKNKPCWKTKDEVLVDCKKLVDYMFNESLQAINIGHFKAKFIERYGYVLDHRKLGYQKLTSLLQTMPDVRVGDNFVYPASTVAQETVPKKLYPFEDKPSNAEIGKQSVALSAKDDDSDSPWEELGPIDSSALSRKEVNLSSQGKDSNYESSLSDDDCSDSEGEASSSKEEQDSKMRADMEYSSLLQTLESWHKYKNNRRGRLDKMGDLG